jgi:hypothetical protein
MLLWWMWSSQSREAGACFGGVTAIGWHHVGELGLGCCMAINGMRC